MRSGQVSRHMLLLLLLLSLFSHVRLCVTPQTAAHQAPPSLGFSRQEHWRGCHFLLQCMKVKRESEVAQLCPTLSDPMGCSLPGFSVHGIFQAGVLEWGAIAFSDNGILLLLLSHFSHVRLCVTPQTAAHQAPLSLGFSRQEYWSGVPSPCPLCYTVGPYCVLSSSVMSDSLQPHEL